MRFTLNLGWVDQSTDDDPRSETIAALMQVAEAVKAGFDAGAIRDTNGNLIGGWSIVAPR